MVERIAHYTILERVGADGIGEVYRARDTRVGRTVSVRVFAPRARGTGAPALSAVEVPALSAVEVPAPSAVEAAVLSEVEAFVRDARAAAALSHPGVAIIYDVGDVSDSVGQPYIASEFVKGQTLRAVVGGHPLNPRRAVDFAAQIADALAEIEAAGIAYDTLTLDSVMVTTRGNVKLLDVGMARWSGLGSSARSNDAGTTARVASGIPALGRVLFEMLTAKPATTLDDGPSTRAERMLPGACRALVMRLTRDKPGAAPESPAIVAAELRQIAAALDAKSADAQSTAAAHAPPRSGSRAGVLVGLLVLIAIGALLWFASR